MALHWGGWCRVCGQSSLCHQGAVSLVQELTPPRWCVQGLQISTAAQKDFSYSFILSSSYTLSITSPPIPSFSTSWHYFLSYVCSLLHSPYSSCYLHHFLQCHLARHYIHTLLIHSSKRHKLTMHLHQVPILRKNGAIIAVPLHASMAWTWTHLPLPFYCWELMP
jgi:hypothetical protein